MVRPSVEPSVFRLIRLMTLAPGHFHAALVQKRALPGIHHRSYIYAPLDADTLAHLARLEAFNTRSENPTVWEVDLRAGANYLERFAKEQPGNTVVLSGKNQPKIDLVQLAVENGLHVIADKPWIIEPHDFPKLEAVFREAETRDVFVWDMLTERFEVTNWLQRELVRDAELFGAWEVGSVTAPALTLTSVHYLKKLVSAKPLVRPWWWFDPTISGESMADVGTHLADLAIGLIAPDQAVDYKTEIQVHAADRSPLMLSESQFREVTALVGFPLALKPLVTNGQLAYSGTNSVTFALRGVHVKLKTVWEYQSPPGGDTHESLAMGTKARVAIRQPVNTQPEVFVWATDPANHSGMLTRLREKCASLQRDFPGLFVSDLGTEAHVRIPDSWRTTHEEHFASVMEEFARYFHTPRALPAWEKPNALARYYITTKAVEIARQ